jgi:hypothetical protein
MINGTRFFVIGTLALMAFGQAGVRRGGPEA